MTIDELDRLSEKIFLKVKGFPGVDKNLIRKCLLGISAMGDQEVEAKIKQLSLFL